MLSIQHVVQVIPYLYRVDKLHSYKQPVYIFLNLSVQKRMCAYRCFFYYVLSTVKSGLCVRALLYPVSTVNIVVRALAYSLSDSTVNHQMNETQPYMPVSLIVKTSYIREVKYNFYASLLFSFLYFFYC